MWEAEWYGAIAGERELGEQWGTRISRYPSWLGASAAGAFASSLTPHTYRPGGQGEE